MEERITELESRIAFQAQTIRDLDDEVRLIAKRLERFERQLTDLAGELRAGHEESDWILEQTGILGGKPYLRGTTLTRGW